MSLSTLPEEVLELILLYVNTKDIPSVLSALERQPGEAFWRRLCLQHGYEMLSDGGESWEEIFCRALAWSKGSYFKTEYDISELAGGEFRLKEQNIFPPYLHFGDIFLKGNKLLIQKNDELLITDTANPKTLLQKLQGIHAQEHKHHSRTKLLLKPSLLSSSCTIYHQEEDGYKKTLDWNNGSNSCLSFVLSDDYFVILNTDINVVRLADKQQFSIEPLPGDRVGSFWLTGQILSIWVIEKNNRCVNHCLRRFDLGLQKWLDGILLFGGAFLDVWLLMNQKFIMSWSFPIQSSYVSLPNINDIQIETQIKVWSVEDNLTQILSTQLSRMQLQGVLLEAHYLIYSSSRSISILDLKKPDEMEKIVNCDEGFFSKRIVASFLLLSYTSGFKLLDLKKATFVREVFFDDGFRYSFFSVGEHFYMAYGGHREDGEEGEQSKLCVFDFTGGSEALQRNPHLTSH